MIIVALILGTLLALAYVLLGIALIASSNDL